VAYRGRLGRRRGQAELLAVMAMALVLAVLVGAVVRFAVLYRQASSQLEERAREVYQVVLSGGLRGYVDSSTGTVYLSSGVPLTVYAVYIHNGTSVLWGSLPAPTYPSYTTYQTPLLYLTNSYAPVYQGPLAAQVNTCSAWVVVVTDKGLFKWCPTYLPLVVSSRVLAAPMDPLGSLRVYYAGNITYFALYGTLSGDYYTFSENSRTTLYPLVVLYQDPVSVVGERWSGFVVNVTLRNPATGDTAWLAFNASSGSVVGKRGGATSPTTYYMVLALPQVGLSAATAVRPLSLGGVDVFAFTVYYAPHTGDATKGYVYASELLTSKAVSVQTTRYLVRDFTSLYSGVLVCSSTWTSNIMEYRVYSQNWGDVFVGVIHPATQASTLALVRQLDVATDNVLHYRNLGTGQYQVEFRTSGSSPIPFSYTYRVSAMPTPASGTSKTSWSDCKTGYPTEVWFYVKASASVRLPSGRAVPIGQDITVQVVSSPPSAAPPSTPTATPTPILPPSRWYVEVDPYPNSTTPMDVKVRVYADGEINPSDYSIYYRVVNDDTGGTVVEGTVSPALISVGGLPKYGYAWELKGDSRKSIYVVVRYKGQDFMTATRWNYLK